MAGFKNENVAVGLPPGSGFQSGISDSDKSSPQPEDNALVSVPSLPEATWDYYNCVLAFHLDSGIVVHRHLPQVDNDWDTLSSCDIYGKDIDKLVGLGVNLKSDDDFDDVVQRMAHSQYFLHLFGQATRVGQQIPIPGIVALSDGTPVIPHDDTRQFAYNRIAGNFSGQVLYHAAWSLWYTLAKPPKKKSTLLPPDLADHVDGTITLPQGVQPPFSIPDDEAVQTQPPIQLQNPVQVNQ